jgi:hypothetical protein
LRITVGKPGDQDAVINAFERFTAKSSKPAVTTGIAD